MIKHIIIIAALVTFAGCGYDRFSDAGQPQTDPPAVTTSLEDVVALCGDLSVEITSDMVTSGYVVSSDKEDNFYKTFVIQDGLCAMEIKAGIHNLHNIFPIGSEVVIRMKGLVMQRYNSVVQLGIKQMHNNKLEVKEFGYRPFLDQYIFRGEKSSAPQVYTGELREDLCGIIVKKEELVLDHYTEPYAVCTNGISIYISRYSLFNDIDLQHKVFSVTGVLQYGLVEGKRGFIIKPSYESDIAF